MLNRTATYETAHARKYLVQLCKHFAHKIEVEYTDTLGKATLPPGPALLEADDTCLHVLISAKDEDGLRLAEHIFDSHLVKFAFREKFEGLKWQ